MSKQRLKKGFTLMELLVYMALIGIIVVIAGEVYSNSVKFRIRSEGMLRSTSLANSVADILQEDLRQMGAKVSFETGSLYQTHSVVYNGAGASDADLSSYTLNDSRDSISFYKTLYDSEGHAQWIQRIEWFVKDENLYRSCRPILQIGTAPLSDDECPEDSVAVLMTKYPTTIEFTPAKRLQDGTRPAVCNLSQGCFNAPYLLQSSNKAGLSQLTTSSDGADVTIDGFSTNYGNNTHYASELYLLPHTAAINAAWNDCLLFNFKKDTTYAVTFQIIVPNSSSAPNFLRNFQPEVDHIGVGFRTNEGNVIPAWDDFLVYPAQKDEESSRYFEFSFPQDVNGVCLVYTIALYSPPPINGTLHISNINIYPRDESSYVRCTECTSLESKKNIKAFFVKLGVKINGETSSVEKLVTTPNNGV